MMFVSGGRVLHATNWRREFVGGETRPQLFECDDGSEWVLKFASNLHQGVQAVAGDWIGTTLAAKAGVLVLECSLIGMTTAALQTMPEQLRSRSGAQIGMAFGSRFEPATSNVMTVSEIVAVADGDSIAHIIVVDTWLDVLDRKRSVGWNLLKTTGAKPNIVAIDFGMSCGEVIGPPLLARPRPEIRSKELLSHVAPDQLRNAVNAVRAISAGEIEMAVYAMPTSWGVDDKKPALVRHLVERQGMMDEMFGGPIERRLSF